MAVKMRLTRLGDKRSPIYRVVITDSRVSRDGKYIENIGHYNPKTEPAEVIIDAERAKYWLGTGVQPTETVKSLLVKAGIIEKSAKLSPSRTKVRKKKK